MGRLFLIDLDGDVYRCKFCFVHLALANDVVSKSKKYEQLEQKQARHRFSSLVHWSFHCKHGKAYLIEKVVNVTFGEKEERLMITGMHTVVDIFCVGCGSIVGWKYESAHEESQQYKEGKYILDRYKVLGPDGSSYAIGQDAQLGGSDADDE